MQPSTGAVDRQLLLLVLHWQHCGLFLTFTIKVFDLLSNAGQLCHVIGRQLPPQRSKVVLQHAARCEVQAGDGASECADMNHSSTWHTV